MYSPRATVSRWLLTLNATPPAARSHHEHQQVVDVPNKLVDFTISSITSGIDAIGKVTTKLEPTHESDFDQPDARRMLQASSKCNPHATPMVVVNPDATPLCRLSCCVLVARTLSSTPPARGQLAALARATPCCIHCDGCIARSSLHVAR